MTDALAIPAGFGRRRFIGGAVAAAVGVGALAGPARGVLDVLPFVGGDVVPFTRTEVLARVGETFRITDGMHAGLRLTVDAVAELPNVREVAAPDDQFAARFAAPDVELDAGMFQFATESFGEMLLYIAPLIDADGRTVGYEALVNRHVPTGGRS